MNARLEAKLSMYQAVHGFINDNNTIVSELSPVLIGLNGGITGTISALSEFMEKTEFSTVPITTNKLVLRRDMESKAAGLAAKIYAYATSLLDGSLIEMAERVRPLKTRSVYAKLKDNITNVKAREIHTVAKSITPESILPFYGIFPTTPATGSDPEDPGTIDQLYNAILAYEAVLAKPREAIEKRKADNQRLLNYYISDIEDRLKKMDNIIYGFGSQNEIGGSAFYNLYIGYKAARNIFDPPTQHTKIRGVITQADTGLPVQQARVRVVSSKGTVFQAFTDEDGSYSINTPKFKEIPYSVSAKKGEMETQHTEVYVKLGKITNLDIVLVPVE